MEASTTEIHHQGRKEMSGAMKNKMTASRRFRPWENLRKLFRRKNLEEDEEEEEMGRNKEGTKRRSSVTHRLSGVFGSVTASLNRSGTDVTIDKSQPALFRSGKSAKGSLLVSGNSGLSRSHDSFPGLYNDDETSSEIVESPVTTVVENVNIIPSSAASPQYMNELRAALGARLRSTPSAVDPIHGSSATSAPVMMPSGSDPSLLGGVNSCELADEVPFMSLQVGMTSRNAAAKMLVNEIIRDDDHDVEEESSSSAPVSSFPLNHSAARHKISIRPKKNHAPARQTRLAVVTQLDAVHVEEESLMIPSAPERKSRMDRNNSNKQRSISLSRTLEHSELSAGVMEAPLHPSEVIGSASSTSKLSRSRSSVEKKIQHEVAVFWRRTKEVGGGLFGGNRTAGSMKDINKQEGSRMTDEREASASVAANNNKRKDLKKIKRDKEEKKTNKTKSDPNGNKTDSESSPPAFLSRIFRSRRSSKRINNKKATSNNTEPLKTEPIEELLWVRKEDVPVVTPNHQLPPLPKPRTVFLPPKTAEVAPPGNKTKISDDEMEVDWTAPNRSSCNNRNSQQQQDSFVRVASPKLNRNREPSPLRHHRIHIAGLSPYQRRVARIGNGLEISDDEWDMEDPSGNGNSVSSPTRSYHFRPEVHHNYNRSDHSLDVADGLTSLPVNINQDFILRKAPVHQRQPSPPTEPPALATTTSNMRRSLEILKFSNTEGLKKTIDSLNQARLSRSSDELSNMTEDMFINGRAARRVSGQRRQSSGSMSNSTSSLNISDLGGEEEVLMTASSQVSLSQHSVEDQRDVRDDVQEVHDQFRWNVNLLEGQRRTETNDEVDTSETSLPMDPSSPKSPSSPKDPLIITPSPGIRISQQPWESRQQTTPPTMFSMSVRVQNPLDNNIAKYKRSVSTPNEDQLQPTSFQPQRNSLPKPFVPTVEDRPPIHQPSAQLAKLVTARPWQSKEEKERQNKVAAVIVAPRPEEPEIPADVKLRSKSRSSTPPESSSPTGQETSELLKVFARRSSKIETPPEEAEAAPQWSRGAMPAVGRSPTEAPESLPVEKMEPAKRKKSPKPLPTMVAPLPRSPPAVVTSGIGAAVSISQPEEREKNVPSSPESMGSPQSLIQTGPHTSFPYIRLPDSIKSPVVDITNNRITTQSSPDSANSVEDIWKRMPSANKSNAIRARGFSGSSKFSPVTKTPPNQEDKVAAASTTGPVRQSKVLDMVHNFQRLQVT